MDLETCGWILFGIVLAVLVRQEWAALRSLGRGACAAWTDEEE